jgi:hypothetical protein
VLKMISMSSWGQQQSCVAEWVVSPGMQRRHGTTGDGRQGERERTYTVLGMFSTSSWGQQQSYMAEWMVSPGMQRRHGTPGDGRQGERTYSVPGMFSISS